MKKTNIILILIIVFLLSLTMLISFFKGNQELSVIYNTEKAKIGNVILKTIASGIVIPEEEVIIRPNISGIVDKIYVKPGEKIKVGDSIASVKIIPNIRNLQAAKNALVSAKIDKENQKKVFTRKKQLFDKGVISANEYDNSKVVFDQSQQVYKASFENYEIVKKGTTRGFHQLAQTIIKATINGVILDIPIEEGNQVIETNNFNYGTAIATIADVSKMMFKGKIHEREVNKIKENMRVNISIGAIPNKKFDGRLTNISSKGVKESGGVQFSIETSIEICETDHIRVGLSANAFIIIDEVEDVIIITESLVQYDKNTKKPFVEIVNDNNEFERRDIELGINDGVKIEVKNGISEKDDILVWDSMETALKKKIIEKAN